MDLDGVLSGYESSVRAAVFLNKIADVSWLQWQEYMDFSVVDDFNLQPILQYSNFRDESGSTNVLRSDSDQQDFQVGDVIVLEALLGTTSVLANDGISRTTLADFENTLETSLLVLTPGGDLNLVPVPAAAWLFGSGLLSLLCFARRERTK